jgi:hypothetical protein
MKSANEQRRAWTVARKAMDRHMPAPLKRTKRFGEKAKRKTNGCIAMASSQRLRQPRRRARNLQKTMAAG